MAKGASSKSGGKIASMTGFARGEGGNSNFSWSWELKSVNGRNLDQRYRRYFGFDPVLPIHLATCIDGAQSFIELANSVADQAAVSFQLRFTRSTQSNTAFLALKVSPTANETRREAAPGARKSATPTQRAQVSVVVAG